MTKPDYPSVKRQQAQRLSDAEWLIAQLFAHEGAECFSEYLNRALEQFNRREKIDRRKP